MAGRPTTYSEEVATELLDLVEQGRPLTPLCKDPKYPHFPSIRTVYNWKLAYPEFKKRLEEAQDHGWDSMADECVDIADTVLEARKEKRVRRENGEEVITEIEVGDNVQRSKLMVATRLKVLELRCNRYRISPSEDKKNKGDKLADKLARIRKKVGM